MSLNDSINVSYQITMAVYFGPYSDQVDRHEDPTASAAAECILLPVPYLLGPTFNIKDSDVPGSAFNPLILFPGSQGPTVFMTDDCIAERKALRTVYPTSKLLLCQFHVLKAVNEWLGKHCPSEKGDYYDYFYAILYSPTVTQLEKM